MDSLYLLEQDIKQVLQNELGMKNHWLQTRKLRLSKATFKFELIGVVPLCEIEVIDNPNPGITIASSDPNFVAFVKSSGAMRLRGLDGFITVYVGGQWVEGWGLLDIVFHRMDVSQWWNTLETGTIRFTFINKIRSKFIKVN